MAFIVFEGLDACGKSTLMALVQEIWNQRSDLGNPQQVSPPQHQSPHGDKSHPPYPEALFLRDPGSTVLGEKLRHVVLEVSQAPTSPTLSTPTRAPTHPTGSTTPTTEAPTTRAEVLIYEAARTQMVEKHIDPHLKSGGWVFCDRFYPSTVAFQGFARGLDLEDLSWLNGFAVRPCVPDLFVYLDITVEESLRRKKKMTQQGEPMDRLELENQDFQKKVHQGYLAQIQAQPSKWLILDGKKNTTQLLEESFQAFKERGWLP